MILPTITLHQPWASLIAEGVKRYETRPRRTHKRGFVAIHAAKVWSRGQRNHQLRQAGFHYGEDHYGFAEFIEPMPLGSVVAVAELTDCQLMANGPYSAPGALIGMDGVGAGERFCGDWRPGRYAWRLENVRKLLEPFPAKGKQCWWYCDVPDELIPEVA